MIQVAHFRGRTKCLSSPSVTDREKQEICHLRALPHRTGTPDKHSKCCKNSIVTEPPASEVSRSLRKVISDRRPRVGAPTVQPDPRVAPVRADTGTPQPPSPSFRPRCPAVKPYLSLISAFSGQQCGVRQVPSCVISQAERERLPPTSYLCAQVGSGTLLFPTAQRAVVRCR